ncbi:MAG: glycosyl hydrolase 53 family protein [Cyclobacteriaceae bacterium]|nr:glycosyl hydrolase 53 family protein [Cyclobacteriaceae bacterium]
MKYDKWVWLFLVAITVFTGCDNSPENKPKEPESTFIEIRAADVSFLPEIREANVPFKNKSGEVQDVLTILKAAGCNTIRLRLWHTPESGRSGLEEVSEFASEIKTKGFKLWVTLHYSDTWADPGSQTKPALWNSLSLGNLTDSVYNYTKKVTTLLAPDFIQVGNEINDGFLWPEGKISTNQATYITLLQEGVRGVRDASANTKIMLHFAGINGADWFYSLAKTHAVDYDIIALSYYPRWHEKSLSVVKNTLTQLVNNHNKDIILAETGYPFTLDWNDWTNNLVGLSDHLVSDYPATEKGQRDFMMQLRKIMAETNRGLGLAYWAPEWVAYKGEQATDGSSWENMALFDFEFKALDAIEVFEDE